jgi:hypothetical protein
MFDDSPFLPYTCCIARNQGSSCDDRTVQIDGLQQGSDLHLIEDVVLKDWVGIDAA